MSSCGLAVGRGGKGRGGGGVTAVCAMRGLSGTHLLHRPVYVKGPGTDRGHDPCHLPGGAPGGVLVLRE